MTPAWKSRVMAKLRENEKAQLEPGNLAELAALLPKADKAGIYRTFTTNQMSSSYVDAICDLLDIAPPLVEQVDGELDQDIEILRAMTPEARRDLMAIAQRMIRK